MSKRNKKKPAKENIVVQPNNRLTARWMYVISSLVILILYGNTTKYDYTLDDGLFVQNHSSVNKGISGIPEIFSQGSLTGNNGKLGQQPYRPVTLTSFALDKAIAGDNPSYSHFINLVLYILLAIVFIQWLTALFPSNPSWITLLITLLFITHPVHIEVVASIKSRDEILAALFGLKAFELMYKVDFSGSWIKKSITPSIVLLLALLSKENAVTLLPLFAFALYSLKKESIRNCIIFSIPWGITVLFYLGLRQLIVGGGGFDESQKIVIHNTLFAPLTTSELWGTKMEFLLEYLRLLLWPYPLSWDYSFNQLPVVGISSFTAIASIIIHVALIAAGFILLRRRPVLSFCIFFYFLTSAVTNNLFFIIGATVAERFLFLPSAGLCIAVVELVSGFFNKAPAKQMSSTLIFLVPVLLIFSVIIWQHSPVWKNNLSLFEAGAKNSPQSARANFALATIYREIAENTQVADSSKKYYSKAITYYENGLQIYTDDAGIYNYLALCYEKTGDILKAKNAFKNALQKRTDDQVALHETALLYANNNNPDSAIYYAERFPKSYPNLIDGYLLLTGSYFAKKDFDKALVYAQKAWQTDSTDRNAIRNMAGVLQELGRSQEAEYYRSKMK